VCFFFPPFSQAAEPDHALVLKQNSETKRKAKIKIRYKTRRESESKPCK